MENRKDQERLFYFGYASNLDEETLSGRTISPFQLIGCARLPRHGFRFSFPNADGSARANIVLSENETVYGLLYQLASEDIAFFKQSEPGYEFLQKEVYVKGMTVSAFTFMASDNVTGIFPDKAYLDIILKGARKNNLPEAYIAMIINRSGPLLF